MKWQTSFISELPEDEQYVDFNGRKLNILIYIFCPLEVGGSNLQKARVLVVRRNEVTDWTRLAQFFQLQVCLNQSGNK